MDGEALVGVEYCVDMLMESTDGALLLIERLDDVPGIAMPGGRIEKRESVATAIRREMREETGLAVSHIRYRSTLVGADRDPRGLKVSIVMQCTVSELESFVGEKGKTRPFVVASLAQLPPQENFVLGHGSFIRQNWQQCA
jgi:8-oxo-dGTP diphosphatase